MRREASLGKIGGRTSEIQRLIGRSLRSVVDMSLLGERVITIDCDVLNADGGTRTASITGGFVALKKSVYNLLKNKEIHKNPIKQHVAAISCGLINTKVYLDLDYDEDSKADVDANFVITEDDSLVEIQVTGEKSTFKDKDLNEMITASKQGVKNLIHIQKSIFWKIKLNF